MFPKIRQYKVIPLLKMKTLDVDDVLHVAEALSSAGLPVMEIVFRRHTDSLAIRAVAAHFPDFLVGAGNILNRDQLLRALDARARFAMAPGVCTEAIREGCTRRITFVPGVSSITDIMTVLNSGVTYFQYFPAETAGGAPFLRDILEPFEHLPLDVVARGGIAPEAMKNYLNLPQVAAVTVDWVIKPEYIVQHRWDLISNEARTALRLAAADS
ncbi:MAG: hypothetical protein PHQ27_09240 [Victivallales bacterium]|nr:hypothetical protein [Victivallales bacterium]